MTDQTTTPTRPAVVHGTVPDPGASALQEDDFGLNGDLRATMLAALEKNWVPDDPGATEIPSDADPAAGTTQPPPATPSPDAPPASGEDGAGGGGDAGDGAAPDLAPPVPGPPPAPDADAQFSLDAYARDYFGTALTPAQARELFGVLGGLQSLSPAQREQVDQIVAGGAQAGQGQNRYPVTQAQPAQFTPPYPVQPGQPITPGQAVPGLPPRPPDEEYEAQRLYDNYIAPLAATTQSQLAQIQADIDRTTQAQLARQQADYDTQISQAATTWRAQYPAITDGEYDALTDRIIRSGTFGPLVNAHGSVSAATSAALDQFFWADPTLRARAIANIASGRQPGDPNSPDPASPVAQQQATIEANRQARAASVAGGGGSTTPRGQAPTPKDATGRKAAMISELASQGDFG